MPSKESKLTKVDSSKAIEADYILGPQLGEGTFGVVVEVRHRVDRTPWAIKIIRKYPTGGGTLSKSWEREARIICLLQHPNIVSCRQIIESNHHIFFVMELCSGGTLAQELEKRTTFDEPLCRSIMKQLSDALAYIHKKNIVHRDIKLDNILIQAPRSDEHVDQNNRTNKRSSVTKLKPTKKLSVENIVTLPQQGASHAPLIVKLSDFGLSLELKKVQETMVEFCGTIIYMAPEIVQGKSYSRQCDMWSLGIILHLLITGKYPFPPMKQEDLFQAICSLDPTKFNLPSEMKMAGKCLARLLHADPAYRYSSSELTMDPWITGQEISDGNIATNVLELMKQFHQTKNKQVDSTDNIDAAISILPAPMVHRYSNLDQRRLSNRDSKE